MIRITRSHRTATVASFVTASMLLSPCYAELEYPTVRQDDTIDTFQIDVADPYRWLEDLESDATRAFIDAQNAVSSAYLDGLPGSAAFEQTLHSLVSNGFPGTPRWKTGRWVTRDFAASGISTWWVQDDLDGERRMLFQSSELLEAGEAPGRWLDLSPNGRILAYSVIVDGTDLHQIRFRDVATGEDLPDRLDGVKFSWPVWTADSGAVIYFRYLRPGNFEGDGIDREPVLAVRRLGDAQDDDSILLRSEADGEIFGAMLDAQGRYLVALQKIWAPDGDQLFLIDLGEGAAPRFDAQPVPMDTTAPSGSALAPPQFLGAHAGRLYLQVQDAEAPTGRIATALVTQPDDWETLISSPDRIINSATLAGGFLVVHARRDVTSELRVFDLDGTFRYEIELPGPGSAFAISGHPERAELHFGFDSLAYPSAILQHDLATGNTARIAETEVPFDRDAFVTRQVFVPSSGGVKVPVFIAHRADLALPAPTMLTDYGIGGSVSEPQFSPSWGAWLHHGGVLALGNIRGGGAYGAEWAAAGTRERRQNTHDDFIAIAEMLISESVTTADQLAIEGASNGGMLVASVMAQRPDLFAVVLPRVGVLDLIRFASFTAGARLKSLTGDPMVPGELPWLLNWSPYHNLHPGTCYPATLIETAVNDDLVHPSQSYKFAARLQAAQGCDHPVLLSIAETGGHYGPDDLDERWRTEARRFAFIAARTGLKVDPDS